MNHENLLVEKEWGICTVTMKSAPEKLNPFTNETGRELRAVVKDIEADDSIRVMILTGSGRGFCSGRPVDRMTAPRPATPGERRGKSERHLRWEMLSPLTEWRESHLMRMMLKPTICALNGVAAGAGVGLALGCDVIIASDQARVRVAFTRIGLMPEFETGCLLPRRIGTHRALELAFTNDLIDAKEMERIGLVNRVVPHDQLMKVAKETAKRMFQIPPVNLALVKRLMWLGDVRAIEEEKAFDVWVERMLYNTEDIEEARASFRERRDPAYKESPTIAPDSGM